MNAESALVKKILLVRTDRIGDVILSLPMLPVIKQIYPEAEISVLVRKYTRELVEHHSCVDEVIVWEENGDRSLGEYVRLLRARRFDIAILPYPRFNLALILFLAGIPLRIGTGYRWYSFLFNRKVYEHRKDAKRHEVEYNLNLLRSLGVDFNAEARFEFAISEPVQQKIDALLAERGLRDFIVLHAGSGGSARDWPLENFAQLGDAVSASLHCSVVLTGGNHEKGLTARIQSLMTSPAANVTGELSLQEMGALLRRAKVFVANSTGPLHIAAAVGTPVVGFYPPIIQCSAVRWGPYTPKKRIFTADNTVCTVCKGGPCQSNVCMEQITVERVLAALKELYYEHR